MAVTADARPRQISADPYGWYVVALLGGILGADWCADYIFFMTLLLSATILRILDGAKAYFVVPSLLKILLIWCAIGGAVSAFEQARLAKPLITKLDKATVSGVIDKAERQAGNRWRFFVQNPTINDRSFVGRVRIISDYPTPVTITDGDAISAEVTLFPLSPPVFEGWPDYRRKAWREGVIATGHGYRIPLFKQDDSDNKAITRIRQSLISLLEADLSPQAAVIGKAMFTGMRDFQDNAIITAFRHSGLAHLLAISGLHMSLFCFGVYLFVRMIFALREDLMRQIAPHKLAACLALASGLFYLGIAGAPLSAIRAFGLAVIVMLAILLDRHLITMRNLHVIAILFLLISPSTLYFPAAQLSFAATYAIVACLSLARQFAMVKELTFFGKSICYLMVSSLAAFVATSPIALYHFGFIAPLGLLANLVAVPLTGFVIMPSFLAYLLLAPISLTSLIAPVMEGGLQLLILVTNFAASFDILLYLKPPHGIVLPLLFIAATSLYGAGKLRYLGCAGLVIVSAVWAITPRPQGALWVQERHIRLVLQDEGVRWQSAKLSPFWQGTLDRLLGKAHSTTLYHCRPHCLVPYGNSHFMISSKADKITCAKIASEAQGDVHIFLRLGQNAPDCAFLIAHHLAPSRQPYKVRISKQGVVLSAPPPDKLQKAWNPNNASFRSAE